MKQVKDINIKHRTYYLFNDKINLKDFDIYNIGYVTIKKNDDYENINSVNMLYLMIHRVIGDIEEKMEVNT